MFEKTQINPRTIAKHISYCPVPAWELMKADFDVEMKKEETSHILSYSVKSHIDDSYSNHFKMSTDGSVSENECASDWLVIPEFKTGEREREKKKKAKKKSFYIGQGISIFTAELAAFVMTLSRQHSSKHWTG